MKKYLVLSLLSFLLVSCGKVENQPLTSEIPNNIQKEVSENIIPKLSQTGEISTGVNSNSGTGILVEKLVSKEDVIISTPIDDSSKEIKEVSSNYTGYSHITFI